MHRVSTSSKELINGEYIHYGVGSLNATFIRLTFFSQNSGSMKHTSPVIRFVNLRITQASWPRTHQTSIIGSDSATYGVYISYCVQEIRLLEQSDITELIEPLEIHIQLKCAFCVTLP